MLVALFNQPRTAEDWNMWSFAHSEDHREIVQAIEAAGGPFFVEYQLDPIAAFDIRSWLERNQRAHNEMNGYLRLQSKDLQRVDVANETEFAAWISLHALEHQTARTELGI